jgi:hypothetical protein
MNSKTDADTEADTEAELDPEEYAANNILYNVWFSIAETIFYKVCNITQLNEDQITALKAVALRPNDFRIKPE